MTTPALMTAAEMRAPLTTTEHEHDRLATACESLLAAVAPEYAGDIPAAIETLAAVIRATGVPTMLRDVLEASTTAKAERAMRQQATRGTQY